MQLVNCGRYNYSLEDLQESFLILVIRIMAKVLVCIENSLPMSIRG